MRKERRVKVKCESYCKDVGLGGLCDHDDADCRYRIVDEIMQRCSQCGESNHIHSRQKGEKG